MKLMATISQLKYEPVLRILPGENLLDSLDELLQMLLSPITPINSEIAIESDTTKGLFKDNKTISQFATSLWRMSRQLNKLDSTGAARVAQQRLKDLQKQLENVGLIIQDFTDQPWRGDAFEAVTGKYQPGETPTITGMSEPRVIYNDEIIQLGIIMVLGAEEEL